MAVRFLSPRDPNLVLKGVPAEFVDGVFDVGDTDVEALGRMRYLGPPHGVVEIGQRTAESPWLTRFELIQEVSDPSSEVGRTVRTALNIDSILARLTALDGKTS